MTWKKLREKTFKLSHKKIVRKTFRLPDGKEADFDIHQEGEIVTLLALTKDHRTILTRQFRPGPEKIFLELPGGRIDPGETPWHAAARELMEETGYKGRLISLGATHDRAYSNLVRHNFLAVDCVKAGEQDLDETEFIEVVLMGMKQFRGCLRQGKLKGIETAYLGLDRLGSLGRNK